MNKRELPFQLLAEFESRIKKFRAKQNNHSSEVNTVGLEQEFFLVDETGAIATHELSQKFLSTFSARGQWKIKETTLFRESQMIDRVSKDRATGGYIAIKYDHHPHLLEVAFASYSNLFTLEEDLKEVFNTLESVAIETNARILLRSHVDASPLEPALTSDLPKMVALRYYRSKLIEAQNQETNSVLQIHNNYAAVIAATQVHFGITNWFEQPQIVSQLYLFEPYILPFACRGAQTSGRDEIQSILRKRWIGYETVFKHFPLVGFPDLESWSLESWADSLLKTPLAGGPLDSYAAKTVVTNAGLPNGNWETFFEAVRDLQIIRPRYFGTLEFRSDPAQTNIRNIMSLAALRFGVCAGIGELIPPFENFQAARTAWWDQIHTHVCEPDISFLDKIKAILFKRNLGEEALLGPYYEFAKR